MSQILVASSDWEDYSLGKEGAERYRIHNLPKVSGPGLYELGITVSSSGLGREIAKLDADCIVVVYLGEADNVRTRLQHYGRSGSHLGNGYLSVEDCKVVPLEKGPSLFQEMFSRGYSIVYRWAPVSMFCFYIYFNQIISFGSCSALGKWIIYWIGLSRSNFLLLVVCSIIWVFWDESCTLYI